MNKLASLIFLLCAALLAGCNKPAEEAKSSSPMTNASVAMPVVEPVAPKVDEKMCFACKGEGTVKCQVCVGGQIECPGTCLRLNRGVWIHMDVPGHPATDLWQKFELGNGYYTAYNQNHVGHVIAMQGGKAVDTGACPICGGTTKVACKACQGTGKQPCPICEGRRFVPLDWSPTNNSWLSRQPDLIRLTDGRILLGKVVSTLGDDITIKTRDGKFMHVKSSDLMPSTGGAVTNAVK